ncbi:MAG: transporter substrate-binding domain-containing protein [Proteobacteria bacterium]|nr:transporter substrate-binding domain-containing protein [Pseudomonadota bacterium]
MRCFTIRIIGVVLFIVSMTVSVSFGTQIYQVGVLDFPPFFIVKNDNEVGGTLADLLRRILDKAGLNYEIHGYPPKRSFKNLKDGVTHITIGIKAVPGYEGHVLYGDSVIDQIEICLYCRENYPLLNSQDDMKGKKIITIRGYGYGGMAAFLTDPMNNITLDQTDSHELALKTLLIGRGDYALDYKRPAEETIKTYSMSGLKYSVMKKLKIHLIVSKKTPDAENVLKKLEEAYNTLQNEEVK